MAEETGNETLNLLLEARTSREKSERARALVDTAFAAVKRTRARQRTSRAFLAGEVRPQYPAKVAEAFARSEDGKPVQYISPQQTMIPVKLIATVADRWPELKRDETSHGRASEAVSTRIERLGNGIMYEKYAYGQSCDLILIDGEAATTVVPSVAHWAAPADQYDYISAAEWRQLPDDLKDLWDWRPGEKGTQGMARPGAYSEDDGGVYRRFGRKYRRDAKGRSPWDAAYLDDDGTSLESWFREDAEATKAAILESIEERVRSRIPLDISLHPFETMAMLNPRFEGRRMLLDGLALREKFDSVDLYSRGLRWGQRSGPNAALVPADSLTKSAPVTLDTMLLTDGDGRPYLIRSVDGCETYQQGEGGEWSETIDLFKDHGIDFLPIAAAYGMHFAVRDVDQRAIPYMLPLMGPLLARDRLMTTTDFHAGQTSWGGWWIKPDPQVVAAMPELAKKVNFDADPMRASTVPGDVIPAIHPGAGPAVMVLKEMIDADLESAGTNPAALGGAGATGMMDRAMIVRDSRRGMSQVWTGVDTLYAWTASNACRVMACLVRKRGKPLSLNMLTEQPGEVPGEKPSPTRSKVVVDADMFGGDYTLRAQRPDRWGDDPATQAMLMDAVDRKKATFSEMRSSVGDPSPMDTLATILWEDYFLNDPDGKKLLLDDVARINSDFERLERERLEAEAEVNAQGVPMGNAAGVADPNAGGLPSGGQQPGVTLDVTANPNGPMGSPGDAMNGATVSASRGSGQLGRIAGIGADASGLMGG